MARRIALFAAWLGATALAVVVAAAAVGTVRTEVTDQPAAGEPFAATTILADATTTTILVTTTTATGSSTTSIADGSDDDTPTTTITSSTTTSTTSPDDDDDDDSAPTTTTAMQTTTTAPSVTKTYNMAGGTVTISASDPDVRFVGASPAAGYTIEVDDRGPNQVKVEFDGAGGESEFVAKWESGVLVVDIDED
jgi:hypothetical protein